MSNTRKRLLRQVGYHQFLYRDPKTGIAWVEDGTAGLGHVCHPSIHRSGSVIGMRQNGGWGKKDRVVESHGWKYNVDRLSVERDDPWGDLARHHCKCGGYHGHPCEPLPVADGPWTTPDRIEWTGMGASLPVLRESHALSAALDNLAWYPLTMKYGYLDQLVYGYRWDPCGMPAPHGSELYGLCDRDAENLALAARLAHPNSVIQAVAWGTVGDHRIYGIQYHAPCQKKFTVRDYAMDLFGLLPRIRRDILPDAGKLVPLNPMSSGPLRWPTNQEA